LSTLVAYSKGKAVNSLGTYTAAVNFHRDSHFERNILKNVVAGVRKEQQGQSKPKRTVTMEIMCALTAMNTTKAQADKDQRLPKLARALAYNQLGQGILRKQSAVCNSEAQWDAGIHLCVADVQILRDQYAVAWGLKHQKQDRFGDQLGPDGRDWVYTSGTLDINGTSSILDIFPMADSYWKLMKFDLLSENEKKVTPFYQTFLFGRPTGHPMTYHQLLNQFRLDLDKLPKSSFPGLVSSEFGLHSFRRFGATVAKLNGLPNDIIQRLGRWNSDTFLTYFVFTVEETIAWQSQLLGGPSNGSHQASGGGIPHTRATCNPPLQPRPAQGAAGSSSRLPQSLPASRVDDRQAALRLAQNLAVRPRGHQGASAALGRAALSVSTARPPNLARSVHPRHGRLRNHF
jgi:alkylhydroperoxidase family enzyme